MAIAGDPANYTGGRSGGATFGGGRSAATGIAGISGGGTLKEIHTDLGVVIKDIKELISVVETLSGKLDRSGNVWQRLTGRGRGGGAPGSPNLSNAGFANPPASGGPAKSPQSAGGENITAATFGGASMFTAGPAGIPARFAAAELAGQGAGAISRLSAAVVNPSTTGIDIQSRIAGIFAGGNQNIGNLSRQFASIPNLGPNTGDLTRAIAMSQTSPVYMGMGPGSRQFGAYQRQMTGLTQLNPLGGASSAQRMLNEMTSNQMMTTLQRYPWAGPGAYNTRTGRLTSPTQMMQTMLNVATGRRIGPGAARQMAGNAGRRAAMMSQMSAMGITDPQLQAMVIRFAAGGETMSGAAGTIPQSLAAQQVRTATQQGGTAQTAYEQSQGLNKVLSGFHQDLSRVLQMVLGGPAGGAGTAGLAGATALQVGLMGYGAAKVGGVVRDVTGLNKPLGRIAARFPQSRILKALAGKGGGLVDEAASALTGTGGPGGKLVSGDFHIDSAKIWITHGTIIDTGGNVVDVGGRKGLGIGATPSAPKSGGLFSKLINNTIGRIPGVGKAAKWLGGKVDAVSNKILGKNSALGKFLKSVGVPEEAVAAIETVGPEALDLGAGAALAGDPPTGSQTTAGMTPKMAAGMKAMMRDNPNIKINSGHRSTKQQATLYALKGGQGVAKPGQSMHQKGRAADVGPTSQLKWIAQNAHKYGLYRPAPGQEPWHLQSMGDPVASPVASTITQGRVDQGVDYSGKGALYATGSGTIVKVQTSGWGSLGNAGLGGMIALKLDNPPDAQHTTIYYAENVVPSVREGQHVNKGDVIGQATGQGGGIEIGWSDPNNPGNPLAPLGQDTGAVTAQGTNFLDFLKGAVMSTSGAADSSAGGSAPTTTTSATTSMMAPVGLSNTFLSRIGGSWLTGGGGATLATSGSGGTPSGGTSGGGTNGSSATTADASTSVPTTGTLTDAQVQAAWLKAGGPANVAKTMAGIAMAESNDRPGVVQSGEPPGLTGYGLWQITPTSGITQNGQFGNLLDPINNAKAALSLYRSGGNSLVAWSGDHYLTNNNISPNSSGIGDPVGLAAFPPPPAPVGGARSSGGRSGSGTANITVNMPIQVVGVSQQDAQRLANMVIAAIKKQTLMDRVASS